MEERLSMKHAAERLGVSVDTIRRRLKKGELVGEKEPRKATCLYWEPCKKRTARRDGWLGYG